MLVHEIRNKTTIIGSFLETVKRRFAPFNDTVLENDYRSADTAIDALESLADTFSPLASRSFRRKRRDSTLEERIEQCLGWYQKEIKKRNIFCNIPPTKTRLAVDPAELDAILINLITNALHWLNQVPKEKRTLDFRIEPMENSDRVRVWVDDSGPGLRSGDADKILLPGITRKPEGIGMGLTIASELVEFYNGRMAVVEAGEIGGASFSFDLPVKK